MVTCDSVVNTYLDNDAENQSHLCAEIIRRRVAQEIVTLCIMVKLWWWSKREYAYKNFILHTTDFVYILICYKLILSVFFNKYIWVFM